jgi:putative nucleotidyltransferase with HDIG domain
MSQNSDSPARNVLSGLARVVSSRLSARKPDAAIAAALGAALLLGAFLLVAFGPGAAAQGDVFASIEAGKVAERDFVADREISFVDQTATDLRVEAEQRLVLPVFFVDDKPASAALARLGQFQDLLDSLVARKIAGDTLFLNVQSQFPGLLHKDEVLALARSPFRKQAFAYSDSILRGLLEEGIVVLPAAGLERFNPDYVEIRGLRQGKPETREVPIGHLVSIRNLGSALEEEISSRRLARPLAVLTAGIVRSFAVEDAFFDAEASLKRIDAVRSKVEPVVRTISKGERIVHKGAIVREADVAKLAAARGAVARVDWGAALGSIWLAAAAVILGLYLLGKGLSERGLRRSGAVLLSAALFAFFLLALALARFAGVEPLELGFLMPTALASMLAAIIVGPRFAILLGLVLALLVQAAAGLDARLLLFCLLASTTATFSVRAASSRIDLVRAGFLLAFLEGASAVLVAAPGSHAVGPVLIAGLLGAANGFTCALLALALLPLLEQALNAPTRFRLMELSDLNSPILKRLFNVAPGTYSHSVSVAHLAESACREIGADPLLARVGAYYHDIGKIEQPEYFIENQAGYNKHDEINPRLSATVIRSHVKIGAEKARALGLPEAIVDIIAQHHGNGVITWFYDQAKKAEGGADADDFSYPGLPPASREAAVVMLADAVEAASRTLKRPTMSRLEEFIREIIMDKVRQGQLDRCDLTFKDLDSIRTSFTRILAGHFHSRIEYPKFKEQPK